MQVVGSGLEHQAQLTWPYPGVLGACGCPGEEQAGQARRSLREARALKEEETAPTGVSLIGHTGLVVTVECGPGAG